MNQLPPPHDQQQQQHRPHQPPSQNLTRAELLGLQLLGSATTEQHRTAAARRDLELLTSLNNNSSSVGA